MVSLYNKVVTSVAFKKDIKMRINQKGIEEISKLALLMDIPIESVLRKSFALLSVCLREKKFGNTIAIVKDNKIIKEVVGY